MGDFKPLLLQFVTYTDRKGPILQGFNHRHLRPWELWEQVDLETELDEWKSMDLLGNQSNSHEDRPWQSAYVKRNVIRKVFEKVGYYLGAGK